MPRSSRAPKTRRTTAATVTATEFKATCLELMDRVARERTAVTVTKRGVPVARLVPAEDDPAPDSFGMLAGTVLLPAGVTVDAALAGAADDWDDSDIFPEPRLPDGAARRG